MRNRSPIVELLFEARGNFQIRIADPRKLPIPRLSGHAAPLQLERRCEGIDPLPELSHDFAFTAFNGDFGDPGRALVIDFHRCSGKINSKAAQIAKELAGAFDYTNAIVAPLILIIVADKIGGARPVFAFDGVQKIFGMTRDLPLRLPKPNEKQSN